MITIDQAKIDAPKFPRSQEWWTGFAGVGTTATVRDDGTVTLEPNGQHYDYVAWMNDPVHQAHRPCDGEECHPPIAERALTPAQRRAAEARLARQMCNLRPLAPAIITEGAQS